ncbi:hypothetical protein PIECOFPK_00876 [Mycovorax composti]|jgi:hypothetical protein|uniref:Uncharacterized protein n=1 Tax=Mycovorax composti TaxID=2962693 RepID=A0ABZ2EIE5_9BACT
MDDFHIKRCPIAENGGDLRSIEQYRNCNYFKL